MKETNLIFGNKPVLEALESKQEIERIFIRQGLHPMKIKNIKKLALEQEIPFQFVPKEKLDRFTRKNHQGIIALVSHLSYMPVDTIVQGLFEKGVNPLILVLDKISDVRNFGSIARTAECAGVDAIVIPSKGSAQINSIAMKTSAGALTNIPVSRNTSLINTVLYLKESGLKIIAATEKSDLSYHQSDLKGPVALMMGSEEKGISHELLALADLQIKIPLLGNVESLNVSVATGILLFEINRQRELS